MERSSSQAILCIYGDKIDIDVLTKDLGITPTTWWRKGDIVRKNLLRKEDNWEFKTNYEETVNASELLEKLYDVFRGKTEIIQGFISKYNAEVKIELVIRIRNNQSPGVTIENHFIDFTKKINALIDIDILL